MYPALLIAVMAVVLLEMLVVFAEMADVFDVTLATVAGVKPSAVVTSLVVNVIAPRRVLKELTPPGLLCRAAIAEVFAAMLVVLAVIKALVAAKLGAAPLKGA